ncbi:YwmB family TATA-box binding protein [Sediminibacillus massiliensis]|uniref:YwmB family TATA-box binding protein n=1 Tax=Sediminibacillus massiliensis TaxID=1926277 RepID=UPI0009887B00|nr:YwmB family TATA-box binding protein [Sediminibacillus massiliensis]
MKVRFILVTLSLAIIFSYSHLTVASSFGKETELEKMHELIKAEGLSVQKWELILKENVQLANYSILTANLHEYFQGAEFQREESDKAVKFFWEDAHKTNGINETFIMIVPKDNQEMIDLTYKMDGAVWNKPAQSYYSSKLALVIKDIFTENMTKFSCVTALSSDKISSVYFFEKITEKLNVQTLDEMQEKDFNVLSGYTEQWKEGIPGENLSTNIQLAARTGLGGQTSITIGTPIILTEY